MSGHVSTEFLAAVQAYLTGPTVEDPDGKLGQLDGRINYVSELIDAVTKDPGYAWHAAQVLRSLANEQTDFNAKLARTLDGKPDA